MLGIMEWLVMIVMLWLLRPLRSEAIFEGLCNHTLTGPASEVVTLSKIKDFLESLNAHGYFSKILGA